MISQESYKTYEQATHTNIMKKISGAKEREGIKDEVIQSARKPTCFPVMVPGGWHNVVSRRRWWAPSPRAGGRRSHGSRLDHASASASTTTGS